jgi:hypothetical protein
MATSMTRKPSRNLEWRPWRAANLPLADLDGDPSPCNLDAIQL